MCSITLPTLGAEGRLSVAFETWRRSAASRDGNPPFISTTSASFLTAAQAGALARKAAVGRVEPFHFSPRYAGEEALIIREVEEAFQR